VTAADRAATLVAWWVAAYTRHLPAGVAQRRRAELASDLWEQRADGAASRTPPAAVALSILRRMAAGIPADLRWRQQQLAAAAQGRPLRPPPRHLPQLLARNWWLALAALLGMLEVVVGADMALQASSGVGVALPGDPSGIARRGVIIGAGGLLALWGIAQRRRWRLAGDLLLAVGVLPVVSWLWAIGPTLLVSLAALTVIVAATADAAEALGLDPRGTAHAAQRRMLLGNAVVLVAVLVADTLMGQPTVGAPIVGLVLLGLLASIGLRRRRRSL
jgi:LPXTG-motif cell wall-anchored protein